MQDKGGMENVSEGFRRVINAAWVVKQENIFSGINAYSALKFFRVGGPPPPMSIKGGPKYH